METNDTIRTKAVNILRNLNSSNNLTAEELSIISSFLLFERTNHRKLARYENLAADGRLKELPCREGFRVYKITTQRDNFDDTEYPAIIQASFRLDMLKDFGESVFLTHEDAEEKIGEKQ